MAKTYTDIAENLPAYRDMAKLIYMSQMIAGIKDADMAFMVLMECEVTGQTLFQWAEENHIVGTRPTMKYDAMIAAYNQLPNCKFEFLEKSADRCAIALTDNGIRKEFSLTWADLQKESIPYVGKESEIVAKLAKGETPPLKDKYATPRSRAVMMYARLVSDAIRSTRPEVTKGKYTPEEVEDFDPASVVVTSPEVKRIAEQPKQETSRVEPAVSPTAKTTLEIAEKLKQRPAAEKTAVATEAEHLQELAEQTTTTKLAAEPTPGSKSKESLSEPAGKERAEALKAKLAELRKEGIDLFARVKAKLASAGIDGLANLSISEADSLMRALEGKQIDKWIQEGIFGVKVPS